MKIIVGIYMVCVAAAAMVFAIFPAQDTYISPVEVRTVETRVVEQAVPNTNLSQEIKISMQEITNVEQRLAAIEAREAHGAEDVDQRIASAVTVANGTAGRTDAIESRVTATEKDIAKERADRKAVNVFLILVGAVALAAGIGSILYTRSNRRPRSYLNLRPSPKDRPGSGS
jgi:phosphate/sulfate permease